jgi:hypothetical protein
MNRQLTPKQQAQYQEFLDQWHSSESGAPTIMNMTFDENEVLKSVDVSVMIPMPLKYIDVEITV